jgi:hypothetical protein
MNSALVPSENAKRRHHLGAIGTDEKIILKWAECSKVSWVIVAQDRVQCEGLLNRVMNLQAH